MPQRIGQKVVNTFVKGLVTEAGELTFPENASIDESNCVLQRDGSRRRRLAVELEDSGSDSSFTVGAGDVFSTGVWKNVGGVAGKNWMVVQTGSMLYFYKTTEEPYSGKELASISVDLTTYEVSSSTYAVASTKVEMTPIEGSLVVVSPAIEPFYIEYTSDTVITTTQIVPRVRDYIWQGDKTLFNANAASPTMGRKYDTSNGGWTGVKGAAALTTYTAANSSEYPPLTLPWFAGKDSDEDFDESEWQKVFAGSSIITNGHHIFDFFNKTRSAAHNATVEEQPDTLDTSLDETEDSRFKTVVAFSGRVFFAGLESTKNSGRILFSRLLDDIREVGDCYQQNDPTSELISDLLDTDGGVVNIPDAANIQKMATMGASLLVFAENGVWSVTGIDGVFSPTGYSVSKVSSVGINNGRTYADMDGAPVWWSKTGIHTLVPDQISGKMNPQNLSIGSIQTFFDAIDGNARQQCEAVFDTINKRVSWFYPSNGETLINKKNEVLILDLVTQSFYPWSITDEAGTTDYVMQGQYFDAFGSELLDLNVTNSAGTNLTKNDTTTEITVQRTSQIASAASALALMVYNSGTGKLTMATFTGTDFLDWGSGDYSSFAEAGYDFLGDLVLKKSAPYIIVYLRPTEEGWTDNGDGTYSIIRDSSLEVSTYWDFRKTVSSAAQEAYRRKFTAVVDTGALTSFEYPDSIVATRLKCRGTGRNMRIRFASTSGKDFVLLGFGVLHGVNQRY